MPSTAQKKSQRGKDTSTKRQRLTIATSESSVASFEKIPSSVNLPSPTGNESILSSTSRSNSVSSLDASESSSPSPDEVRSKKKAGSFGEKKKKIAPIGIASSPRQHPRVQKSASAQMQGAQKKPPQGMPVGNFGIAPPGAIGVGHHVATGAIGDGRRAVGPRQMQQPMQQPPAPTTGAPSAAAGHSKSIMQQLREERMRRLQEHYMRKLQAGEAWPGFDATPATMGESLWDEDHDPWRGTSLARGAPGPLAGEDRRQVSVRFRY